MLNPYDGGGGGGNTAIRQAMLFTVRSHGTNPSIVRYGYARIEAFCRHSAHEKARYPGIIDKEKCRLRGGENVSLSSPVIALR